MKLRFGLTCTFAAVFALAAAPLGLSAAPNGLAWDSVTKIAMNADPSSLQPGPFDDDYAAAAAVQTPEQSGGGGIFGQMKQAMAAGQGLQQMMQSGMAEKHYVAGSKERTDSVAAQTATITDCAARTITTLDLRRKTYRVVSMDQPSTPSGGGGGSKPSVSDNGARVAISVTNTALGARDVGGQPTNGYRADMTIVVTDSSGESHTQNADMLGYYSSIARPAPNCFAVVPMLGGGGPSSMMGGYARLMQALSAAGTNSRFSIKQSGPTLPLGKLSMYDAVTFGTEGRGATFVTERGHVHAIGADDPAFSIPSDFTQQQ